MRNRILINLVLFIIIALTAGFLFLTSPEEDRKPVVKLTTIDPATIEDIRIIRRDLDDLIFRKLPQGWFMSSPYDYHANPQRIQTLLNLLQSVSLTQLDAEPDELPRFLLDNPRASVVFNNHLQVDFGDSSPLGSQRYVRLNEKIHLINEGLFQQLLTPATFFLSPKLVPGKEKIMSIIFPGHTLQMQAGNWQVMPGVTVSAEKLNDLVNAWENARALTISEYTEQDVAKKLIIGLDQDKQIEFVIVNDPPNLTLARPDLALQFHMNEFDTERMWLDQILHPENNEEPGEIMDNPRKDP